MRNSQFKGKNIETSIDKLNRYFDNVFENVNFFDGAQAAVFRPENPNVFPSTSTGMLADVVLTFTDWTDNFRVDLTNPSILGKSLSMSSSRNDQTKHLMTHKHLLKDDMISSTGSYDTPDVFYRLDKIHFRTRMAVQILVQLKWTYIKLPIQYKL